MLMFLISFLLIKFKYKINEENHASMIKAINARYEGGEYRDELLDELDANTAKKSKKASKKQKNHENCKKTIKEILKEELTNIHNKGNK